MNENRSILDLFKRNPHLKYALATVVRIYGSSYRMPGAKMLISEKGEISGSVSGGCLERDLIRRASESIYHERSCLVRYDTRADAEDSDADDAESKHLLVQNAGLGCEGVIEIFLEPRPYAHLAALEKCLIDGKEIRFDVSLPDGSIFMDRIRPPNRLIIFGAGPDIVAMVELGYALGWDVTVVDCHSSFPVPKRLFQKATRLLSLPADAVLDSLPIDANTFIALMTHNYEHDQAILEQLATAPPFRYLGILGPKTRGHKLIHELKSSNSILPAQSIHFPMGLDIGGENSQAIALATFAEMQSLQHGRDAQFLKYRHNSIHSTLS